MGNLFASNNTDRIESAKVYMFSNENYQKFKSSLTFTVQPEYYNAGDMPLFSVEEVNDISLIENK